MSTFLDTANPNKIHKPTCVWVTEDNFTEKVIANRCKNGHYYWVKDIETAKATWSASECSTCLGM